MIGSPFPLDSEDARVIGCLVEKGATTPDQYPMTLNGVRVACNQSSNRDPIVDYDEATVERALRRLADRALVKMVHRPGDRVVKYRHALDAALELDDSALALITVLLLRGDQTPGELRQRTGRYVTFDSLLDLERVLDALGDRRLVQRLERRPGHKEVRYRHLLCGDDGNVAGDDRRGADDETPAGFSPAVSAREHQPSPGPEPAPDAVASLAEEVAELRTRFERLLEELGVDDV